MILPRAELDRRELAAYSAGWADVVDEQLPGIRRAYEQRITAAYLQGQEDARTGRRPRRARRPEAERGTGEVIPLPYVQLLRPPSEVTRVEERGERERSVADAAPMPAPGGGGAAGPGVAGPGAANLVPAAQGSGSVSDPDAGSRARSGSGSGSGLGSGSGSGPASPSLSASVPASPPGGAHDALASGGEARASHGEPSPSDAVVAGVLLSAREVREKRTVPPERRPVVRRNGRPSVPPLARPGDPGAGRDRGRRSDAGERPQEEPGEPLAVQGVERPRLSDRARALADELEGRTVGRRRNDQAGPPEPR